MTTQSQASSTCSQNTHALISLYEELRQQAINGCQLPLFPNGFGLFITKGMASWAHTQLALLPDNMTTQIKPKIYDATAPSLSGEIKAQATQILAQMALHYITEIVV